MRRSKPTHRAALPAIAIVFALLAFASSALAVERFVLDGSFSGPGSDPGQVQDPKRAAVEQSTGNVFIADQGNGEVDVFKADGSYLTSFGAAALDAPFGITIAESGGQATVYVSDGAVGKVQRFDSDEAATPSFTLDAGYAGPAAGPGPEAVGDFAAPLALAPNGDLWLADKGDDKLQRYTPSGSFVSSIDGSTSSGGAFSSLLDLAVDSQGRIYAVDAFSTGGANEFIENQPDGAFAEGQSRVERFAADGTHQLTLAGLNRAATVAVDPATDNVAVSADQDAVNGNSSPSLHFFDPAGTELYSWLSEVQYTTVHGLAIEPATFRVWSVNDVGYWNTEIYGQAGVGLHRFVLAEPPVVSFATPVAQQSGVALSGTVDPKGLPTTYEFEYRIAGAGEWLTVPGGAGDAGAGSGTVPLTATLASFEPSTAYEFRLIATNIAGTTEADPETVTSTTLPPAVETLSADEIPGNAATLYGRVDPNKEPTTYHFEFGTTAAYGQAVPAGGAAVEGADGFELLAAQAAGLQPGTTYHFRLVATNATGTSFGADKTFTTTAATPCPNAAVRAEQGSTYLPDCRAYEVVTPRYKAGYDISGNNEGWEVDLGIAANGDTVSYASFQPLPGTKSGSYTGLMGVRGPEGWETSALLPTPGPNQLGIGLPGADSHLLASTPDQLTHVYWEGTTRWGHMGIRRPDGSHQVILEGVDAESCLAWSAGYCEGQAHVQGMTADGRHVVFGSSRALVPGLTQTGDTYLYEWIDDGAGTIRLVSRTNDPEPTPIGASSARLGAIPAEAGASTPASASNHAISADGERIFFQSPSPAGDGEPPVESKLYLREGGAETVELSAPTPGHSPAMTIRYLDAAEDGSVAYFYADGKLTDDADPVGGIYRYDVGGRELSYVARSSFAFGLIPTAITSPDGSQLYFEDENPDPSGGGILKLADAAGVRTVGPGIVVGKVFIGPGIAARGLVNAGCSTANFSADGRYLFFAGTAGYAGFEGPKAEAWRYDAETEELTKLSTGPTAPPPSEAQSVWLAGGCGAPFERGLPHRVISSDNEYVFFDTANGLVPRDVNGVKDVYRWHDGEVRLVSSGTDPFETNFAGTDPEAKNAFIITRNRLAPEDGDTLVDIYSVRVNGGFARPEAPICNGEGCRGSYNGGSSGRSPGTATFEGGGDQPEARASILPMNASQRALLAAGKRATLKVKVGAPGQVKAKVTAKLGGKQRTVATASKRVKAAGTVALKLRLKKPALKHLARGKALRLRIVIRFGDTTLERGLTLEGAK